MKFQCCPHFLPNYLTVLLAAHNHEAQYLSHLCWWLGLEQWMATDFIILSDTGSLISCAVPPPVLKRSCLFDVWTFFALCFMSLHRVDSCLMVLDTSLCELNSECIFVHAIAFCSTANSWFSLLSMVSTKLLSLTILINKNLSLSTKFFASRICHCARMERR